jgi:hypothetical protein
LEQTGNLLVSLLSQKQPLAFGAFTEPIKAWQVKAKSILMLSLGGPEPEVVDSGADASDQTPEARDTLPF